MTERSGHYLMLIINKTEVYGWQSAIRGMRNPMNSWEQGDSSYGCENQFCKDCGFNNNWCGNTVEYKIGEKDYDLMKRLVKAGSDHSKFMRMINVTCDITAPRYWWIEYDTYKVGTVRNSCSTMHKIHAKEFTLDDFSNEHCGGFLGGIVDTLNGWRDQYCKTKDKEYWYAMIQLLPQSYNQKATVQLNYAVLRNMYHSRKNHKLDEWHVFCEWIERLPYSELITMEVKNG